MVESNACPQAQHSTNSSWQHNASAVKWCMASSQVVQPKASLRTTVCTRMHCLRLKRRIVMTPVLQADP